jgi:hypothetical protein
LSPLLVFPETPFDASDEDDATQISVDAQIDDEFLAVSIADNPLRKRVRIAK